MNELRRILLVVYAFLIAGLAVLLWVTAPGSARANSNVLYVAPPPAGNDTNPCSLSSPCATVQHAVDVSAPGGHILVATGVYTGVQASGGMTQVVYIDTSVSIQGGYSSDFSTWDPVAYPTTLDAEGEGRVVSIVGGTITATLDSLVITGGDATGLPVNCPQAGAATSGCGGGILVHNAEALISGNVISGNLAAVSAGGHSASGGGICVVYGGNTVISGNLIAHNYASQGMSGMGGGIDMYYPYNVEVVSNQVLDNVATTHASLAGWGGGIAIRGSGAAATISGNQIAGNQTNSGNGGYGAGIYNSYGSSTIAGNYLTNNSGASAVYLENYEGGRFEANQVISNSTNIGIRLAYAAWGIPTLANNIVARSGETAAIQAAAISGDPLTVELVHNTLVGAETGNGIEVATGDVTLQLSNNIIADQGWGIVNLEPSLSTILADHTLFWNNGQNGITGTDPVYGDPAFINPGGGDYHIGMGSAAIDAAVDVGELHDLDGDWRPIGPEPDIGADEAWRWIVLPLILRGS